MDRSDKHEARADQTADTLRRHVIGFNAGGIAAVLAAATSFAGLRVHPAWAVPPLLCFSVGLFIVAISLGIQKHKALQRLRAVLRGESEPDYDRAMLRNSSWDWAGLVAFAVGVLLAASMISSMRVSP